MRIGTQVTCVVVLLLTATIVHASCFAPVAVAHRRAGTPQGGVFDLRGTAYEKQMEPGPPMRFWAWSNYQKANSGTRDPYQKGVEWLIHPSLRMKDMLEKQGIKTLLPGYWVVYQMNWTGKGVEGCIREVEPKRTVVEMSFADPAREGTTKHAGYYLIASIEAPEGTLTFDMDRLVNAKGERVIPVAPIPAPKVLKVEQHPKNDKYKLVTVELADPVSYSEGGPDKPVKLASGLRLYYAKGEEPTSSKPEGYEPVGGAKDPKKELGLVPLGKGKVQVAVPAGDVWLVSRVQYADSSAELLSEAVSSHVSLDAKSADAKRRRSP